METGKWKLESRNWKLETGKRKLRNRNWKVEIGNKKMEASSHLPVSIF
jgi:hypothetical protein